VNEAFAHCETHCAANLRHGHQFCLDLFTFSNANESNITPLASRFSYPRRTDFAFLLQTLIFQVTSRPSQLQTTENLLFAIAGHHGTPFRASGEPLEGMQSASRSSDSPVASALLFVSYADKHSSTHRHPNRQ
jgi:hypothetical protein